MAVGAHAKKNCYPMSTVYLSTAYLAPVQYYAKLLAYDQVRIEQHDHYLKQTYRNRCTIASPNGKIDLTIPVEKSEMLKCETKDIRISDHGNWRRLHFTAMESAYGHTPYFEYYKDDFAPFYERPFKYLFDFNEQLMELVCSLIDIEPNWQRTDEYAQSFASNETDARDLIHPKKDFSQTDSEFQAVPYYQVFEQRFGFIPNLSIADLLFNMGPESLLILKQCHKTQTNAPC